MVSFVIGGEVDRPHPTFWFIWDDNRLLFIDGHLPKSDLGLCLTERQNVGIADGLAYRSALLVGKPPGNAQWVSMRQALADMPPSTRQALSRARQLHLHDREHRFCSACGTPLVQNRHDTGRHCPHCAMVFYPRLSPAMMVAVTRGHEILLARAPHFSPGVYSALAGFVEPGETLEQCVERETMEEVGISICNLRYVDSQSWPFPHSLMLAFVADYAGGDIVPQEAEIEDANWFDIDRLPPLPSPASIAWRLIHHTVDLIRGDTGHA
jgi:NAD+ diphosphatase